VYRNSYPINISLPGAGMIAMVSKRYNTITDEFIQQWLYDLYEKYMVQPEYLLVSQATSDEIHYMLMEEMYSHGYIRIYADNEQGEREERYPNKITYQPLRIVVFPGLPEKTLFSASMLTMANEHSTIDALGNITTVTRKYKRLRW